MMDEKTIRRLNELNRAFYDNVAEEFDTTRRRPWPGWRLLLPYVPHANPVRVLDAGCGNGRFGAFLRASVRQEIHYTGVDSNAALLERARATLEALPEMRVRLIERDILNGELPSGPFDMVVLFGVIHHIPGYESRRALLQSLAQGLAVGGILAFACWRFYEFDRFRERIVPWPDDLRVERGDYLLDWRRGANALRYCHYVDDAEHEALVAATGLAPVATYRADGHEGNANLYAVLRRKS